MRERTISLPQLGLIAGTRAMLGAGVGLLLADRLSREQRRAVGFTLLAVGVVTTFPLLAQLVQQGREREHAVGKSPSPRASKAEPSRLL